MPAFYTIYEDAKGERRFYQGDRRELLPNLRRLGTGYVHSFPVKYPVEMSNGELIYDDFPNFNEPEWPDAPKDEAFDWDLSLSQIDSKIGDKSDIVVRNKGIKVSPTRKPKPFGKLGLRSPDIAKIFCCYCGAWLVAPLVATREHLVPVSLRGNNSKENLRPCCGPCNTWRSSLPYNTWIGRVRQILKDKPSHMQGGRIYFKQDMEAIISNALILKDYVAKHFTILTLPEESVVEPITQEIGMSDRIRDRIYAPKRPVNKNTTPWIGGLKSVSKEVVKNISDSDLRLQYKQAHPNAPDWYFKYWKEPVPDFHEKTY